MKIRSSRFIPKLILLLILALVFEETLYAWLPIGPTAYLVAKIWTELLLYGLFLLILGFRIYHHDGRHNVLSTFDILLLAFIALGIASTVLNHGSLVAGGLNIRTMLRYVAVYYIIVLTFHPDMKSLGATVPRIIVTVALIQSLLAVMQHFAGDAFTVRYFAPLDLCKGAMGLMKLPHGGSYKLGAAIGTFGKPAAMGFFLLIAAVFAYVQSLHHHGRARLRWMLAYLIILTGILLTYKRGSLLLGLSVPVLVPWLAGYRRLVLKNVSAGLAVVAIVIGFFVYSGSSVAHQKTREVRVSPVASLMMLTTAEYWTISTRKSRGWVVLEVGGQALSSFRPIGYGADVTNAQTQLSKVGGEFAKLVGWGALDDVYVVATLVYFGPVGLILILLCFRFIYRRARWLSRSDNSTYEILGLSVCAVLIIAFLGSFLERTLELRAFAFCIWVLAGLVVAATSVDRNVRSPLAGIS